MTVAASVLSSAKTGGRDDWRTPEVVLERVRRMGRIALDPCAPSDPDLYIADVMNMTVELDGLARSWLFHCGTAGLAFVNPPYSRCDEWVGKVLAEAALGVSIVLLVAARPGARWYRKAKAHADAVAEWRGRIKFVGAQHSAPFPSALFAYNLSWRRFAAALDGVADVEVPR